MVKKTPATLFKRMAKKLSKAGESIINEPAIGNLKAKNIGEGFYIVEAEKKTFKTSI